MTDGAKLDSRPVAADKCTKRSVRPLTSNDCWWSSRAARPSSATLGLTLSSQSATATGSGANDTLAQVDSTIRAWWIVVVVVVVCVALLAHTIALAGLLLIVGLGGSLTAEMTLFRRNRRRREPAAARVRLPMPPIRRWRIHAPLLTRAEPGLCVHEQRWSGIQSELLCMHGALGARCLRRLRPRTNGRG